MTVVVDDALLLEILAGRGPDDLQGACDRGEAYTTSAWYWRLTRAVVRPSAGGALGRVLLALPADVQAEVLAAVEDLPRSIGLPSPRRLVPVMAAIDIDRTLDFLTAEAVAIAISVDGALVVTTRSELLSRTCDRLGVELRVQGL